MPSEAVGALASDGTLHGLAMVLDKGRRTTLLSRPGGWR
jgi:hypothetical protein